MKAFIFTFCGGGVVWVILSSAQGFWLFTSIFLLLDSGCQELNLDCCVQGKYPTSCTISLAPVAFNFSVSWHLYNIVVSFFKFH